MEFENLFQLLGLNDPADWTIDGVERAWFELTLAARNSDSTVHRTQQEAYRYLRDHSADAQKLVEELTGAPYEFDEPANTVLHCMLIVAARTADPLSLRNAEVAAAFVRHANFGGFTVFRHEYDPYLYSVTEGFSPGEEFVREDQSGPPLKNGQPRFGEHSSPDVFVFGPITFFEHLREFFVDLLLFRWIRSNNVFRLAGKVAILYFISGWLLQATETLIARTDVWEDRWVSDEIMAGTDDAEETLRVLRKRFRDLERKGENAFGWDEWWKQVPPPEIAYALNSGDLERRELYKKIRLRAAEVELRLQSITPKVDQIARYARATKSRDGAYRAVRTSDDAEQLAKDLEEVRDDLLTYVALY